MRNLSEYPISYDETEKLLRRLKDEFLAENEINMICGDNRPIILQWAIDRLDEYRKIEDHFEKTKTARMPNRGY